MNEGIGSSRGERAMGLAHSFDGKLWRRLIRVNDFEAAAQLVVDYASSASTAADDLYRFYLGLGNDLGYILISSFWDVTPDAAAPLLWKVYLDSGCPGDARNQAMWGLQNLRAPGLEEHQIDGLRARSPELRWGTLLALAAYGTSASTPAVLGRINIILKRSGRQESWLAVIMTCVHVFRCGNQAQLEDLARTIRTRKTHLMKEELAWLEALWPTALVDDADAPIT